MRCGPPAIATAVLTAVLTAILAAAMSVRAVNAAVASCDRLVQLARPDLAIAAARPVPAGPYAAPGMALPLRVRAFCRVAGTLKPSPDSRINFELWMPSSGWNGKFQGVGNGGWSGSIPYEQLAASLERGYAVAASDTGHVGPSGSFALGRPERLVDFAYRAVHEMTVESKAIVDAFYGGPPRHSYWVGCSSGGRQGLKEAQRFPDDYDGIIAGAPANAWTHLAVSTVWIAQATLMDPAGYIPRLKFRLLHDAALDACDAVDGVKDGVIDDPTRCHFDPAVLQCEAGDDRPTCLTAGQVEAARKIYGGPKNSRTGNPIFPGLEPGSELGWDELAGGPRLGTSAGDHFRFVVFKNPQWDFRTFDFDADVTHTDLIDEGSINAVDPDLKRFASRNGKLILYHGWSDPLIAPRSTVDYYAAVADALGGNENARNSARLFMVPGMAHCGGGDGASSFDMLAALERWIERGSAPDSVDASRLRGGAVVRTRPLCAYPGVARYLGKGSTDEAANFSCVRP
jgi:feruloyl esterase